MPENIELGNQARDQILKLLSEAVTKFAEDAQLVHGELGSRNHKEFEWIHDVGKEAVINLKLFWQNLPHYSEDTLPQYLDLVIYDSSPISVGKEIKSLEAFAVWLKGIENQSTIANSFNNLLVLTIASEISTYPTGFDPGRIHRARRLPSPQSILVYAAISCLFLCYEAFRLTVGDMYYLLATLTLHKSEARGPLKELFEENIIPKDFHVGHTGSLPANPTMWYTVNTKSLCSNLRLRNSTKQLIFPDSIPEHKESWQYMEIIQPHARRPTSDMQFAIWGSWNTSVQSSWSAISTFGQNNVAKAYIKLIDHVIIQQPELLRGLSNHWLPLLQYIYILGLNDSSLRLRDTAEFLGEFKYHNVADTRSAAVNVCLMKIEHLKYHRDLVNRLRMDLDKFPMSWKVSHAPGWAGDIRNTCQVLEADISKIHREAIELRKLLIEQQSLAQSRKTALLTLMASLFIPMGFVATIFGMNTKEINDSSWPSKYYVAIALPLTALTLAVPLYALQAFNFIARAVKNNRLLRRTLKWGLFTFQWIWAILGIAFLRSSPSVWASAACVVLDSWIVFSFAFIFPGIRLPSTGQSKKHWFWDRKWWVIGYILSLACFVMAYVLLAEMIFVPLVVYPMVRVWIWFRSRKKV